MPRLVVSSPNAADVALNIDRSGSRVEKRRRVAQLLQDNPQLSDREIARLAAVSPTTVGSARKVSSFDDVEGVHFQREASSIEGAEAVQFGGPNVLKRYTRGARARAGTAYDGRERERAADRDRASRRAKKALAARQLLYLARVSGLPLMIGGDDKLVIGGGRRVAADLIDQLYHHEPEIVALMRQARLAAPELQRGCVLMLPADRGGYRQCDQPVGHGGRFCHEHLTSNDIPIGEAAIMPPRRAFPVPSTAGNMADRPNDNRRRIATGRPRMTKTGTVRNRSGLRLRTVQPGQRNLGILTTAKAATP